MTTIAWDGKTLAGDKRIVEDSYIICDDYNKISSFPLGVSYCGDELRAIGVAGVVKDYEKLIFMFMMHEFEGFETENSTEVTAIVVGEKFVYELEQGSSNLIRYEKETKLSVGSGSPFARAAMCLNKSAIQAVKLASKLDSSTGSNTSCISFKKE